MSDELFECFISYEVLKHTAEGRERNKEINCIYVVKYIKINILDPVTQIIDHRSEY